MLFESFNRTRWLDKLRPAGSGATLLKTRYVRVILAPEPRKFSLYCPTRETRTRQSFLYRSKLDYTSRFARVIQAVQVSFKLCLSPCAGAKTHLDTCVPPCAKAVPISVSFKSDYTSRFVHGRRASILAREHPQPTSRVPPRVACHPCR